MIGIVFNFNMMDEPYNQNKVNHGFNSLQKFEKKYNEEVYVSYGDVRNSLFVGNEEDYVIVHHTNNLDVNVKTELTEIIKEILSKKKSIYHNTEMPKIVIVFQKIEKDNCFIF